MDPVPISVAPPARQSWRRKLRRLCRVESLAGGDTKKKIHSYLFKNDI